MLGFLVTPLLLSSSDFRVRFSKLLSDKFKKMDYKLAMRLALNLFFLVHSILGGFDHFLISLLFFSSVLNPKINFTEVDSSGSSANGYLKKLDRVFSPYDMERLRAYTDNLVDFNLVSYIFLK